MSLSNPNKPVTEERLSEFYDRIKGYMGGGSGGTSDYTDLQNKPSIEGVTLTGNKTASDLGLAKTSDLPSVYEGDTAGLVPAAGSDNEGKYLDNDGNWTDPLEDFVQISGGKVLLDIPANTYSTFIEAFAAVKAFLDTLTREQLPSIAIIFGKNAFYFGRDREDTTASSFYHFMHSEYNNSTSEGAYIIAKITSDSGIVGGKWSFKTTNNQVTYSSYGFSSAEQHTAIKLIDTSVSATMIGKINRSDIYDTTEKVIGKWTDGRPVYQKTFAGTLNNANVVGTEVGTLVSVGASVSSYVEVEGIILNGTSKSMHAITTIKKGDYYLRMLAKPNDAPNNANNIELYNAWFTSGTNTYVVTVKYTKTTDAANSYNYADENDYSTSEKIIGKWISGKPVYQRTFVENITSSSSAPTTTNFDLVSNIPNLDNVIKVDLTGKINDTSNVIMPLPLKNAAKTDVLTAYFYRYKKSGNTPIIELTATEAAAGNSLVVYITVQYTKS